MYTITAHLIKQRRKTENQVPKFITEVKGQMSFAYDLHPHILNVEL